MPNLTCPQCNATLKFGVDPTGKKVKCARCERLFVAQRQAEVEEQPEGKVVHSKCPLCGAPVKPGAVKCPKCKGAIGTKPCPACREPVPGVAEICPHCETPLRGSAGQQAAQAGPNIVVQQQAAAPSVVVLDRRPGFNHTLHLILTVLTCGVWAPVWLVLYLVQKAD